MKICYIVAMEAEAAPFIEHYGVKKVPGAFSPLPCQLYEKRFDDTHSLYIVTNGTQHGSSLVGCEAASVTTLKAIESLQPDVIVNSGTCGAFKANGAKIGDVYIGHSVMFHDRRVMGDDEWGTQALGNYSLFDGKERLAKNLGMKMGKVTTGSSLDMQPCDLEIIKENGGELKDMEAAAVAFVCSLFSMPCLLVKSVTDLLDGGVDTLEEFRANLSYASSELAKANVRVVRYLLDNNITRNIADTH